MTMHIGAGPRLTHRKVDRVAVPALLPWVLIAILFAVAIMLRQVLAANTDVSWLLTVGERVLGGQRLYVDVFETNPPMAVLVYLPAIVIARARVAGGSRGRRLDVCRDTCIARDRRAYPEELISSCRRERLAAGAACICRIRDPAHAGIRPARAHRRRRTVAAARSPGRAHER
ncbi:MAG: hypothetical protein Q8M18_12005 [Bradyrhizobium sp.]|nr:hypothetical protein [Bradyrhizobium sp.]